MQGVSFKPTVKPSIQSVFIRIDWVGSLPAGMIIGFLLSFVLVRFFDKIPTKNPILKSVILSFIALVIGAILLEAPSSFGTSNALYYFLFGTMLNVPRFLVLGIVIGYLYKRLHGSESLRQSELFASQKI